MTAALATGAIVAATPANAEVISVGDGRNVGIFHNIDFVAGFGWAEGQTLTVEVLRNGQRIGSAAGPTIAVDEGLALRGALEVNHGPEGAPAPGDCWTSFTPDIQPGDEVRLTQGLATDSVIIDPITVDEGPFVNGDGKVEVRGRATRPDGTPIEMAFLDSGAVLNTSKFRGGPNELFRSPGTTDGWTMIFDPASPMDAPGRDGREPAGLDPASRLALLMSGEYAQGYGHVAPLPLETQLFEGNEEAPGPALGCEAAASESNAVSAADDGAVNLTSGDLAVDGRVMAGTFDNDITSVVPRVSDGTTTVTGAPIDVTGDVRTWAATFQRADLDTLLDGKLTLSADYVTAEGAIGGQALSVTKDVVAPVVTPDRAPGTYTGPISVALSAGPGETITYRSDGLPHASSDARYTGPIALGFGDTTLAVRVTDAAGNVTDTALAYTVNRPSVLAPPLLGPSTPPAGGPAGPAARLDASSLRVAKRIKARSVRRSGLRVSFLAPSGAKVARVTLYRLRGDRRQKVASKSQSIRGGRRNAVRLKGRGLKPGRYLMVVRVGRSRSSLGPASTIRTRIVR